MGGRYCEINSPLGPLNFNRGLVEPPLECVGMDFIQSKTMDVITYLFDSRN